MSNALNSGHGDQAPLGTCPDHVHFGEPTGHVGSGPVSMTYDSDELPVLIRLPDLSDGGPTTGPHCQPLAASPSETRDADREDPPSNAGQDRGEQPFRRRTIDRMHQKIGRPTRFRTGSGWLNSLGQLAMAAVLAAVLLAIIITFQERKSRSPSDTATADGDPSDVAFEFTQAPIGPASDVGGGQNTSPVDEQNSWPPDPSTAATESADKRAWPASNQMGPPTERPPPEVVTDEVSGRQMQPNAASRAVNAISAWPPNRPVEANSVSSAPAARPNVRYPDTHQRAGSSTPRAVPRFSADQWRNDALSSGVREARRTNDHRSPEANRSPENLPTTRR